MSEALYTPSAQRKKQSLMFQMMQEKGLDHYDDLYKWSVEEKEEFWCEIIKLFNLKIEGSLKQSKVNSFLDYSWFPDAQMSFAENLLQGNSNDIALDFFHESGFEEAITYDDLRTQVASVSEYLKTIIEPEDVVACLMPNISQTIISMLATNAIGGVFTSTSCDFGVNGVVDRFGQSEPKVLITTLYYDYNGKTFDLNEKIQLILDQVSSIEKVIVVDFLKRSIEIPSDYISWDSLLMEKKEPSFLKRAFSAPLYIMYSSGTTGKPKCIIHSQGGSLLQHVKELGLHCDLKKEKSIFYFTTCGWMMWNWLVSSLAFGSRLGLYEGSPGYPSLKSFMKKLDEKQFNIVGLSPKFLRAIELDSYDHDFEFNTLETILSTGAPLLEEQFDFVYDKIKKDIQLSSISGGTDILGCFMLGNPILPVYRGEIQCRGLGMNVKSFSENAEAVIDKEGELVCLDSFPSQPIGFLNDPDQVKFKSAYFERFKGIWHHGDFITVNKSGGVLVHGRSDATLNPGGVRIGTAEIYRQTEKLSFIDDSIAVGKSVDGDIDIWLFVKLKEGDELDEEKVNQIKKIIRSKTTPRHVPRRVIETKGIPYTRSGKKMEILVNRLINKKAVDNIQAVGNPECLDFYEKIN